MPSLVGSEMCIRDSINAEYMGYVSQHEKEKPFLKISRPPNTLLMSMIPIIIACLITSVLTEQQVPITPLYDGFVEGPSNGTFHLEFFYDLVCPDSRDQQFILQNIFKSYQFPNLKITYHMFPLPYHKNAYAIAQTMRVLASLFNDTEVIGFMNYFFPIQDKFYGDPTTSLTDAQILNMIADVVHGHFGQKLDTMSFIQRYHERTYDLEARSSWKYGCSRGISGTPISLANGVVIDGAQSFTLDDWLTFLGKYTKIVPVGEVFTPEMFLAQIHNGLPLIHRFLFSLNCLLLSFCCINMNVSYLLRLLSKTPRPMYSQL
eukprot:TRINITY_DN6173_c0_g1_i11.p1 TRINITY_DN6173_c0_g1~~TRINITY_DN6173_c0_g1_i11.p1  ORF type:complete len:318 (+),score=30.50 TRINITY_DN6173_c0_g1_i11:71-1024(+)